MSIDDYKELMRFHILLCDEDISEHHYAAVDKNGSIWVYAGIPMCDEDSFWNDGTAIDIMQIGNIPKHRLWKNSVIEI